MWVRKTQREGASVVAESGEGGISGGRCGQTDSSVATGQGGRRLKPAIRLSPHEGFVASARALWVAWWGQQNLGRVGSGE